MAGREQRSPQELRQEPSLSGRNRKVSRNEPRNTSAAANSRKTTNENVERRIAAVGKVAAPEPTLASRRAALAPDGGGAGMA